MRIITLLSRYYHVIKLFINRIDTRTKLTLKNISILFCYSYIQILGTLSIRLFRYVTSKFININCNIFDIYFQRNWFKFEERHSSLFFSLLRLKISRLFPADFWTNPFRFGAYITTAYFSQCLLTRLELNRRWRSATQKRGHLQFWYRVFAAQNRITIFLIPCF